MGIIVRTAGEGKGALLYSRPTSCLNAEAIHQGGEQEPACLYVEPDIVSRGT